MVVAFPFTTREEETDTAEVDALPRVVRPVTFNVVPNVPDDCVENAPVEVVVALPLIESDDDAESADVDALLKMFNAPLNV